MLKKSLRKLAPGTGWRIGSTEGVVLRHDKQECTTVIYFRESVGSKPGVTLWSDVVVVQVLPVHPFHVPGELLDRYGIKVEG